MEHEEKYADHFIKIDDMMELKMKIPIHLNVLELKALMYKTDKLFKLSEVQIVQHKIAGQKRSANIKRRQHEIYNKDVMNDLINLKSRNLPASKIRDFLNDKYGESLGMRITNEKVNAKYYYHSSVKGDAKNYYSENYSVPEIFNEKSVEEHVQKLAETVQSAPIRSTGTRQRLFSDEEESKIKLLIADGMTATPVYEAVKKEFGDKFTKQQIISKIKYIRDSQTPKPLPTIVEKPKSNESLSHVFPPDVELRVVQLANDGKDAKEIRDTVNEEFDGRLYSKKQISDKMYNLHKRGKIQ